MGRKIPENNMERVMSRFAMVCLLSLATAAPVMAQEREFSWGIMGGSNNYSQKNFSFDMASVTGRLSYNLNQIIDVEARLAYGANTSSNGVSMGINWLTGAYAKARWEVMERLYVTALGGYTIANTTAKQSTGELSETDGGLGGGLGLDFYADRSSGLNMEWIRYFDSTRYGANYTIDHVGVGYFQKF